MFESKLDTNIHVQTWDGCALDNYKEDSMMKTFALCLWIRRINLQLIVKLELICHFCFNSAWIHNENLCPLKCYRAMIVHAQPDGLYWTGVMLTCHALHTCTSTINVNILKWSNFQLSIEQVSVEWLSLFTFRRCHELLTECQIG